MNKDFLIFLLLCSFVTGTFYSLQALENVTQKNDTLLEQNQEANNPKYTFDKGIE
jgi:hypothetical protein